MSLINKILVSILVVVLLFLGINTVKKTEKSSKIKSSNNVNQSNNKLNSQENEGGNVIVTVKPKILEIGKKPIFEMEFNTHSIDLDFDIAKQVYLIDDKNRILKKSIWNGGSAGGHHRAGNLSFNDLLTETKYVQLVIKDIAGVSERKFKWNL